MSDLTRTKIVECRSLPRASAGLPVLAVPALALSSWLTACHVPGPSSPPDAPTLVFEASPVYPAKTGFLPAETSAGDNFLLNPSFERGFDPWFAVLAPSWSPFYLVDEPVRTGLRAAGVRLRPREGARTCVHGIVQDLAPSEFPRHLAGWYFVTRWEQGWSTQYIQVVVVVDPTEAERRSLPPELRRVRSLQMRYVLAGVDRPPIKVSNARFVLVSKEPPVPGRWVYFERDLLEDFRTHWGITPDTPRRIRVLYEARYDGLSDFSLPIAADVCFDDLYLGR